MRMAEKRRISGSPIAGIIVTLIFLQNHQIASDSGYCLQGKIMESLLESWGV